MEPPYEPVSLSLIRLRTVTSKNRQFGYETHVHGEAAVAASLIAALRHCAPADDIFIAVPHRVQREAVRSALEKLKSRNLEERLQDMSVHPVEEPFKNVLVDTVERLQGTCSANHFEMSIDTIAIQARRRRSLSASFHSQNYIQST